ncbi:MULTISPECIES: DNA gyrase inhibitor YacG [Shewanella]|jgi:hypothetical protein|uniref:DNA gyrase inhibitor YacG n=6 Tax=Shewanella TaxID=22 RepID=YACG_SHEB9|nr:MULTISPECIES: DNA gyrase inhibitor YacG [Shewanella]A6WTC9.1 RecName: Full=DNA gyrase inhibitor YacG [Shewanella baltica OS185]A9L5D1.1 RecName: Full=DNA gyrase inhibitor YacG [Shewanella baltica OS195]EGT3628020.1 DNA gyrase inhibitor YacG [Morganella morganii]MBU1392822.1 DNA gyrase inhibitor YacG [Gammaproteobacteria bacterium]QYX64370.1 DNA gyrase inhibitor YacG [Shewanella putrefaciens]GCF91443.1 DNA gyrase inhibitor YacG [Shewanella sp. M-Br]ABS10068.1 protein of unknown function DU
MPLTVNCPICKAPVEWVPQSAFKPFCSERCKLIDLGDWASEKHVIPVKAEFDPEAFDEFDLDEGDFFKE